MDCETAWQHAHVGPRLTDADFVTSGDAALRIIAPVWGSDDEYLSRHRRDYEEMMDRHRRRKIRGLLAQGRNAEAWQEVAQLTRPSLRLYARSLVPAGVTRLASAAGRPATR